MGREKEQGYIFHEFNFIRISKEILWQINGIRLDKIN